MKKQTPSAAELHTAVKVLAELEARIGFETAYSVIQLPPTQSGLRFALSLKERAVEQTLRIKTVSAQLENWRQELAAQRGAAVYLPRWVRSLGSLASAKMFWLRIKNLMAVKLPARTNGMSKMLPKNEY